MKKYWRSLDELTKGPDRQAEFVAETDHKSLVLDLGSEEVTEAKASRRDFLKLVGFSFATAAITSSCEKPVQKAIPYLIKPEEITPGKASYYATSFFDGNEYCSVLAKVRDGRPIKIEANKLSKVSGGGTSARVQASVLELYDESRLKDPMKVSTKISWDALDTEVIGKLKGSGKKVLLTSTLISPSLIHVINQLSQQLPDLEWIQYDEIPASALRKAHLASFGKAIIPSYYFDKADYILSFDADFLGTWLTPVEFAAAYAKKRDVSKEHPEMSKHIQVESAYSMTGSNADERYPMTPKAWKSMLVKLHNALAEKLGAAKVKDLDCAFDVAPMVEGLLANQGSSIVLSSSQDLAVQSLVLAINQMLGNYGSTLDLHRALNVKKGDDESLNALKKSLDNNEVSLLLAHDVNPVYSAGIPGLKESIKKAGLSVYIGSMKNETATACKYLAPDHHYLEAWGDAEPVTGSYSLQQPTIHPLYNSRAFMDSLLKWSGSEQESYESIKAYWESELYPYANSMSGFEEWWTKVLQDGVFDLAQADRQSYSYSPVSAVPEVGAGGMTLAVYTSVGVMDGRHANNPWLQELPDPVSKVCWDNYLAVAPADAEELGLEDEDLVTVAGITVPVLIQPGQAKGSCSMALGYGRTVAGKVGDNVGVNAFSILKSTGGSRVFEVDNISIEKTGDKYPIARTQTHHNMEGRPIVRETSLESYKKDPNAGNHFHLEAEAHHDSLYPDKKFDGYHWGLAVDLNKCTGCNNCVVSCTAENNVATVGKEEVKNRRIMHWLRIDRYFSEEVDNPRTFHQPVMCQHCDNAPCENVCPVSATMHSNEGLNQVAYVRCIGTKYCINNCPYRVRRFNWFKYVNNDKFNFHLNSETGKMVLNPDVTVRSRGVVEKCTFCVQRIQEKKLEAKLEDRAVADGEIQTACVQSCPTGALIFGNLNDKESKVSKSMENERNYHLLEQLHTLPSVGYLTKVRNVEGMEEEESHGEDHGHAEHS